MNTARPVLPGSRVTNELDFLPLPTAPVRANQGAVSRTAYFVDRIDVPFRIQTARIQFAANTQRTLRIALWCCPNNSTRPVTSISGGSTMPLEGVNLMTGGGGAATYQVGDGAEGEIIIPIHRDFGAFWYPAVDAYNTDGFSHTVNVSFDLVQRLIFQEHSLSLSA